MGETRKRFGLGALGVFGALALGGAAAETPPEGPQSTFSVPHVAAQLLVKAQPGAGEAEVQAALAPFGGTVLEFDARAELFIVEIADDAQLEAAAAALQADPQIDFAEPNFLFEHGGRPNDTRFPEQWSKDNVGVNAPGGDGYAGADMNMIAAWEQQPSATDVVLAIIDDGIETAHTDLADNILGSGKCFASPNSPRPCTNGEDDPNPADAQDFHGTLVAGAAAARGDNVTGVAGAAWQTGILPLKVDLSSYAVVKAVDEAIAQEADIINMSFGGPVQSSAQEEALERAEAAGVLVVAAAGNAHASNDNAVHYPSGTSQPHVLSVAATTGQDRVAGFSQWGSFAVDLAAPGQSVLTTAIGDSYASATGTSFAAPHIAGIAALVKSRTGAADYARLAAHLLHGGVAGVTASGSEPAPGFDESQLPGRVRSGRIDAEKALTGPEDSGVLLLSGVEIDDSAGGNGNGVLEPGETASLVVTLENRWESESGVTGTLSTPDSERLSVNDTLPVAFGTVPSGGRASAPFSVTLAPSAAGNQQLLLQLELGSTAQPELPPRYFYLETGALDNGKTVSQAIQRWDWDEFQRFHVDVPVGTTGLKVSTSGSGDIDLLLRHEQPPEYLITLDGGGGDFYYVDSETSVSGGPDADEALTLTAPLPGVYHLVVVNYDRAPKTYDITATYTTSDSDSVAFTAERFSVDESAGEGVIAVNRSGAVGEASVEYAASPDTATPGEDFTTVTGTLSWAAGENGEKSFRVPILDDADDEPQETVALSLSNAEGTMPGLPDSAVLQIDDDDGVADGEGGADGDDDGGGGSGATGSSGGGGSAGLGLVWLLLVLALVRARGGVLRLSSALCIICASNRCGVEQSGSSSGS